MHIRTVDEINHIRNCENEELLYKCIIIFKNRSLYPIASKQRYGSVPMKVEPEVQI